MITLLTILHVVVCILLILVVLLQSGKGSDLGSVFGGGASQTLFGTGGSKTIMTKITTGLAVLFMLLSFILAVMPAQKKESGLQKEMQKEESSSETTPSSTIPATTQTDTNNAVVDTGKTVPQGKPKTPIIPANDKPSK